VSRETEEEKLLAAWDNYIWKVAGSFQQIPHFVDEEDLKQVGDTLLIELHKKSGHLPDEEFARYFKVCLTHKLDSLVYLYTAKCRDMNKTVSIEGSDSGDTSDCASMDVVDSGYKDYSYPRYRLPDEEVRFKLSMQDLREKLSADEQRVLDLYLDPPLALHEEFQKGLIESKKSFYTKLPFYVIHRTLGWVREDYTKSVLKSFKLKLLEHLECFDFMIDMFPQDFPGDPKEEPHEEAKEG